MKTALKILGALVGVLVIGCVAVWATMFRHPSPAEVCANIRAIAQKEGGDAAAKAIGESCEDDLRPPTHGGEVPYASRMKCMKAATTLGEVQKCEKSSSGS
jgi:hypothetical protein